MRVAIVGSRTASMADVIAAVHEFTKTYGMISHVVSGGAGGADTHAAVYAASFGVPVTIHRADWDTHGKSAGYRRNVVIVEDSEAVLAVWDGVSKGTQHTMQLARDREKPLLVYRTQDSRTHT